MRVFEASILLFIVGATMGCKAVDACTCGSSSKPSATASGAAPAGPRALSLADVSALVQTKAANTFVYDANPRELYEEKHVPGASWVKFDEVTTAVLPAD